jgi:biotin transporter BioY
MIQQQKGCEETQEKAIAKERLEFRYAKRRFWTIRIFMLLGMMSIPLLIWGASAISNTHLSSVMSMVSTFVSFASSSLIIDWRKKRWEESWVREHGNEIFTIDEEGIEWKGGNETVWIRWEEVTHAYIENNVCILEKEGAKEQVIRFWNVDACLNNINDKYNFFFYNPLPALVAERCPLLQSHPWEQKDPETISTKSPRFAYKIADAKVFSYHTKANRLTANGKTMGFAYIAFLLGAFLSGLLKDSYHFSLLVAFIIAFIPVLGVIYYRYFLCWQWYVKSQIETDDLGIALVEPRGVTWRVLWFTIASYTADEKYGIITTKDGKAYKFPLNTARADELHKEIMRRIGADDTEDQT